MRAGEGTVSKYDLPSFAGPLIFFALVLGLPTGIATAPSIFRDGDTSWQIAAGQWILRNGRIPTADPFSFTAAGHPWVAMEWLAEVIFAAAFKFAGFAGLACLVAASLILVHALLFFFLQKRVSLPALAAILLMLDFVLAPLVLARPLVLAWPLLAGWTILLTKAAETGRPPPLWCNLILVVWTNLHASFPLAILVGGCLGLDALIKTRGTTLRDWAVFAGAGLAAASLNANGFAGLLQPFKTSTLAMLPLIGEWHPSSLHSTPYFFAVLLLGAAALLWTRISVPIGRALLLLVMLAMALAHVRHQSSFIIVAACVLPALSRPKPSAAAIPKWLLAGALPLLAVRALWPLTLPQSEATPRALLAAVPTGLRESPLFNSYIFGGPLIRAGIRPYIDGRAEIYGDEFVANYVNITKGDMRAFDRAVQHYDIRWAAVAKSNRKLITAIEASGDWQRIYSDDVGVIEIRSATQQPSQTMASPGRFTP
jgi:hypothetical protein